MSLALLFQPPSGRAGVVQPASGLNMKKKILHGCVEIF